MQNQIPMQRNHAIDIIIIIIVTALMWQHRLASCSTPTRSLLRVLSASYTNLCHYHNISSRSSLCSQSSHIDAMELFLNWIELTTAMVDYISLASNSHRNSNRNSNTNSNIGEGTGYEDTLYGMVHGTCYLLVQHSFILRQVERRGGVVWVQPLFYWWCVLVCMVPTRR